MGKLKNLNFTCLKKNLQTESLSKMSLQLALRSTCGTVGSANLLRRLAPSLHSTSNAFSTSTPPQSKPEEMSAFWKKNVDLKRPVSPHLQVYAPQLTSMLSITNRMTGVVTTVGIMAFANAMLLSSSPFAVHLQNLKCLGLPHWFHMGTKFIIAWCFSYHTLAGFRHLVWDTKQMLKLDQIYTTGYIMAASSVIMAIILTLL